MKQNKRNIFVLIIAVLLIFSACSGGFNSFSSSEVQMAPMSYGGFGWADEAAVWDMAGAEGADNFQSFTASYNPARAVDIGMPMLAPTPATERHDTQVDWEDVAGQNERHIIQNAHVQMETEEFDDVVSVLRQLSHASEGYVESEMLTNRGQRIFTIVMRVPVANFEAVLAQVESLADVRFTNQSAQDVTDRFYDLASGLETRRIEEERILSLIDEAEGVHDLLALETRLSNTRLSIETYLAQLNNMAGQIAFSTINVTLFDIFEEDIVVAAPTLGERIGGAFGDSVDSTVTTAQDIIVFLAGVVIPFAILAVFIFIAYLFVKLLRRKIKVN